MQFVIPIFPSSMHPECHSWVASRFSLLLTFDHGITLRVSPRMQGLCLLAKFGVSNHSYVGYDCQPGQSDRSTDMSLIIQAMSICELIKAHDVCYYSTICCRQLLV